MNEITTEAFIHPTCDVSPRAIIGAGTKIWNWSQIREDVVIGSNTTVGQMVYLGVRVRIGDRCRVMPKVGIDTGAEIGNDVFIGPYAIFTNDDSPRAWSTRDLRGVRWVVEDGASVGANVVVLPNVSIGHHALVAAHSTVSRDVPPHALVCGSPARRVGWVCTEGHRMRLVREVPEGAWYACPRGDRDVLVLNEWRQGRWICRSPLSQPQLASPPLAKDLLGRRNGTPSPRASRGTPHEI
jgi:acetyltransferase-like isoleucine patch superfamily enzyme